MNKEPVFRNKNGSLSIYALCCGYVQYKTFENNNNDIAVKLYKEHSIFTVHSYDYKNHVELHYECFESLVDARKSYAQCIKQANKLQDNIQ